MIAHWWEKGSRIVGAPSCVESSVREQNDEGQVVGIARGGPEGWEITVSFGPLLDLLGRPLKFNPSQIRAILRPLQSPTGGCESCGGITLADSPKSGDV